MDDFKKSIAFPEENKMFAGDFLLIGIKQTLIWFNLQKDGTRNELSNIKETFPESLQQNVSFASTYEHLPFFKAGVSSSYDGWEKCKEKVPFVSDPNQNIETTWNSKLKFT